MEGSHSDPKELEIISKEFTTRTLFNILVKYTGSSDVTLDGWKLEPFGKIGDSYLSSLYKMHIFATLNASQQKIQVPIFIKGLPSNIGRRKTYRSVDFFYTEIMFYTKVWPKLSEFAKLKNVSLTFLNIPDYYVSLCDGVNDFLVLEDISVRKFHQVDRNVELDFEHCKIIMKMFAQFHSLSFAFKDQHPQEYEEMAKILRETYFLEDFRPWYAEFHKNLINVWLEVVEKKIQGTKYEKKFRQFATEDLYGHMVKIVERKSPLNVICEGDSWLPNILIRYSDQSLSKRPESSMLIDFQLARISSPTLDLSFFLYSCTEQSLRTNYWDDLIETYVQAFQENLKNLGSSPSLFDRKMLEEDMIKNAKFGLGMSMEAVVFCLMDNSDTADLDSIQGNEAVNISTIWTLKSVEEDWKKQRMIDVIKDQVDRGFI